MDLIGVFMAGSFNQKGFGAPVGVQGSLGGLGGGLGGIMNGQMKSINEMQPNAKPNPMVQNDVMGGLQTKSPTPGINSAYMKAPTLESANPQKGTPSGARSFLGSGAGLNGMMNSMKSRLGQNRLGGR